MISFDTIIEIRFIWVLLLIFFTAFILGFFLRDLEFLIDELVLIFRNKRLSRKTPTRQ